MLALWQQPAESVLQVSKSSLLSEQIECIGKVQFPQQMWGMNNQAWSEADRESLPDSEVTTGAMEHLLSNKLAMTACRLSVG